MKSTLSSHFFENLQPFTIELDLFNDKYYHKLPEDWFVIVSDIKNSSEAIIDGLYKNINVVAVASIIGSRNACKGMEIPFIFGGDGAFIFVPSEFKTDVEMGLSLTKQRALEEFNLEFRISIISMSKIVEKGGEIYIAKRKLSNTAVIAMAKGSGLNIAEELTKKRNEFEIAANKSFEYNAYEGFECNWDSIQSKKGEILTLIIQSTNSDFSSYEQIYEQISKIAPHLSFVAQDKSNIQYSYANFFKETIMKYHGIPRYFNFIFKSIQMFYKTLKFRLDGKSFVGLNDLSTNTDHLKFDNYLRMIIDVEPRQREKVLEYLTSLQDQGKIFFGYHINNEVLLTCYVRSHKDHLHFVDGGSGGYALAAQKLKQNKLSSIPKAS